jgi:hypothetical protein
MTRLLKNLRIDEVSCTIKGANPGARVLIRKSDDAPGVLFFDDIMKAKTSDVLRGPRDEDDDKKLSPPLDPKIEAVVAAAMALPPTDHGYNAEGKRVISPAMTRPEALHWVTRTARGAAFARHHANITKGIAMNRSEEMQQMRKFVKDGGMAAIAKRIIETGTTSLNEMEYTTLVQEAASLNEVSFEKAFNDPATQQAYAIVREAGYVQALGYTKDHAPQPRAAEPLPGVGLTYDQLLEMRAAT